MNVLVDMYICDPRPSNGWEGYTYRAWTSVVFLLYSGIAKPSRCVKNERTSRFFVCMGTRAFLYIIVVAASIGVVLYYLFVSFSIF